MANLYPQLLAVHSWLRWIVLLAAIAAVLVSVSGWGGTKPAGTNLRRWSVIFVSAIDLNFLLGLILYFGASPITRAALA